VSFHLLAARLRRVPRVGKKTEVPEDGAAGVVTIAGNDTTEARSPGTAGLIGRGITGMTLSEEFLLLALDSKRGVARMLVDYGLAGAVLRELTEAQRIRIEGCRFSVRDDRPTGDAALDGVLATLAHTDRCRALRYWVRELAQEGTIRPLILERLADAGVACRDERAPFGATRGGRGARGCAGPAADVVQRIRAVLLDEASADAPTVTLIGMLEACLLMGTVLTRGEHRRAKRRILELVESDPIARAADAVVAGGEVVRSGAPEPVWAALSPHEARQMRASL
jgi:golgi phosphoprotein 3